MAAKAGLHFAHFALNCCGDGFGIVAATVDVDGDNTYDVVTDESGNVLADVPSTLTVSDSESIVSANNGETGYLAQNEHDNVSDSDLDNPMDDVVDLG